jgi:hypothetical protein
MKNAVFWDVALFLQNVGSQKIYTAPHPRRWHSSEAKLLAKKLNGIIFGVMVRPMV